MSVQPEMNHYAVEETNHNLLDYAFQGFANLKTKSPSKSMDSASCTERTSFDMTPMRAVEGLLDDSREEEAVAMASADGAAAVRVSNLDTHTDNKMLFEMFFPYGAQEAFLRSGGDGSARRQGIVIFPSETHARLAMEKMNRFIPCRQSQPIQVEIHNGSNANAGAVSATSAPTNRINTAPFTGPALLQVPATPTTLREVVENASTTPRHVAHFIQQTNDPAATADEVCTTLEVSNECLRKYAESLAAVMSSWGSRRELQTAVVRNLLSTIMRAEKSETSRVNAGRLLGELFTTGFITGDPHDLCLRLLNSDVHDAIMVDAVITASQVAAELNPQSANQMWVSVAGMAATHPNLNIRWACASQLVRKRTVVPVSSTPVKNGNSALSPDARPFVMRDVGSPLSSIGSHNGSFSSPKIQGDELRLRTVYVSRLCPTVPQLTLLQLFRQCGEVNKVRLCAENNHPTLYGFVEMSSQEAARLLARHDRTELGGTVLRLQPARSPILDSDPSDAKIEDGVRVRPCRFGLGENQELPAGHGKSFKRV